MRVVCVSSDRRPPPRPSATSSVEFVHVHAPSWCRAARLGRAHGTDGADIFVGADCIAFVPVGPADLGEASDRLAALAIRYVTAHPACGLAVLASADRELWTPLRLRLNLGRLGVLREWPETDLELVEALRGTRVSGALVNPEGVLAPEAGTDAPKTAFISYASGDRALVDWISRELTAAGLEVLRDVVDFQVGAGILSEVRRCIAASDVVISVITERSVDRGWPSQEVVAARELGVPVVPLIAGLTIVDGSVAALLGHPLYGRLTTLHDDHDREILLDAVLGRRRNPAPRNAALRTFVLGIVGDLPTDCVAGEGGELVLDLCAALFGVLVSTAVSIRILLLDIPPRQDHTSFSELLAAELHKRVVPLLPPGRLVIESVRPTRGDLRGRGRLFECSAVISVGGLRSTGWLRGREEVPLRFVRGLADFALRLFRPEDLEITQVELNLAFRRRPVRRPWIPLSFCPGFSADLSLELSRSWYGPTARTLSAACIQRLAERRPSREALVEGLKQLIGGGSPASAGPSEDDDAADLIADRAVERGRRGLISLLVRTAWTLGGSVWGLLVVAFAALLYFGTSTREARLVGSLEAELGDLLDPADLQSVMALNGGDAVAPAGEGIRAVTQYVLHGPRETGALKVMVYDFRKLESDVSRSVDVRSATSLGDEVPGTACIYEVKSVPPVSAPAWEVVTLSSTAVRAVSQFPEPGERRGSRTTLSVAVDASFDGRLVCAVAYGGLSGVSNAFILAPWTAAGLATEFRVYVGQVTRAGPRGVSSFYPLWESERRYLAVDLTFDRPIAPAPASPDTQAVVRDLLIAIQDALKDVCADEGTCSAAGGLTTKGFQDGLDRLSLEGGLSSPMTNFQFWEPAVPLIRAQDIVYLSVASRSGAQYTPTDWHGAWYANVGRPLRAAFRR